MLVNKIINKAKDIVKKSKDIMDIKPISFTNFMIQNKIYERGNL